MGRGGHDLRVNSDDCQQRLLMKEYTFYTPELHIGCELECGLRSGLEESSIDLDNRHQSNICSVIC